VTDRCAVIELYAVSKGVVVRAKKRSTRREFLASQAATWAAAAWSMHGSARSSATEPNAEPDTEPCAEPGTDTDRAASSDEMLEKGRTAATLGRKFLVGLFDPAVDLLPEYRGANVYWLYHDNYLAAKVLAPHDQALVDRIAASIRKRGVTKSGKIEILFDESPQGFPFRQYELTEVQRVGERVIKTEVVTGEPFKGWREYTDLLLMAAIFKAKDGRDLDGAKQDFAAALETWDGRGLKDQVTKKTGLYATYKLALALVAAARLKVRPDVGDAIYRTLLTQQADDGGWITDYDARGQRVGLANVETTSLAVLAIERWQAAAS
jgi:hypothetical protein